MISIEIFIQRKGIEMEKGGIHLRKKENFHIDGDERDTRYNTIR